MKRGMRIQINFSNRWLYTFIFLGILIIISVGVYAYGTSNPANFGHSVGELNFSGGFTVPTGNIILSTGRLGIGANPASTILFQVGDSIYSNGSSVGIDRTPVADYRFWSPTIATTRLTVEGVITVGHPAYGLSTQPNYNSFGAGSGAGSPSSGQISNLYDVYIYDDLEVDGTAYIGSYGSGDIAENLHTKESIQNEICGNDVGCYRESGGTLDYGDLVCVDSNAKKTIMKCNEKNADNAVGFVSETYSMIVGNGSGYPIALAGLVPAHMTNENGNINPGDLLVSSSKPGYAMKKGDLIGGMIVGIAFDFCDKKDCKALVFVSLSYSDPVISEMKDSLCELGVKKWC